MNKNLIIIKWNSLLLSLASVLTGAIVLYSTHKFVLPLFLLLSAILKLVGIARNCPKMRLWGLIGINVSWGLVSAWFFGFHTPRSLYAGLFAFFILLFGIGVGVQERFHGH